MSLIDDINHAHEIKNEMFRPLVDHIMRFMLDLGKDDDAEKAATRIITLGNMLIEIGVLTLAFAGLNQKSHLLYLCSSVCDNLNVVIDDIPVFIPKGIGKT